jgi:protein-disulfide isomerase
MDQNTTSSLSLPIEPVDHALGPEAAPVTLVWYGDYECDFCARAFPVIERLVDTMRDGLRLVYRHFPVASVHPHASIAAQGAESAGAQGKYWAMHNILFQHQDRLADSDMTYFATRAGVEIYKFNADMSIGRFAGKVRRDYESGRASGVAGTPAFFINGQRYPGPMEFDAMHQGLLAAATPNG